MSSTEEETSGGDPPQQEEGDTSTEDGGEDGDDARQNEQKDVFGGVYAHEGAKTAVGAALRQGDIHVLFEGPPGSGKSAFLLALESNVPGVMYRDGDQITAAKLRDVLKQDPPILLIDEIDALDNDAYDVLSTPMEHGRLVRDSARESYDVTVGTQVIAACNDRTELPEHIANRFRTLEFEPYTDEEYVDLCAKMLVNEVGWVETEEEAREAAKKVKKITGEADPREARDTARMARSLDEIDELAMALHDADAEMEARPLLPAEVKRAQGEVGKEHLREVLVDEMMEESGGDGEEPADGASDRDETPGVDVEKPASKRGGNPRGPDEDEIEAEIEQAVEDAVV